MVSRLAARFWMKVLGRPTLRPQMSPLDWDRQDHGHLTGSELHYPGDRCPERIYKPKYQ